MGDVVTALGRAVQDEGHSVEVLVPKYDVINYDQVGRSRQRIAHLKPLTPATKGGA
jgi:glycogen synthase